MSPSRLETPPGLQRGGGQVLAPVLVAVLTAIAFLPALANGFVDWDDRVNFLYNPEFRGLSWENLRWMFTTFQTGKYQPLSWMTAGLDYLVWGMNPFGYHLTALGLHAANAVLFYFLAARLIRLADPGAGDARLGASCGALFFSVHPLRVESVAWASDRGDALAGFFFLATLLLYVSAVRRGKGLALAAAAYALSLLAKAIGLALPLVLVLLDVYPLRRPALRLWREKLPFLALSIGAGLVGYRAQASSTALVPVAGFGWTARFWQALFAPAFYVWKTVWPAGLSPLYEMSSLLDPLPFRLGALATFLITGFCAASWRRRPWALAAWAYALLLLLPVLGLVKLGRQAAADRYTYLAGLGAAVLFGAAASRLWRLRGRAGLLRWAAPAAVAIFAALASLQALVWENPLSLWSRVVALSPESYFARKNLAAALAEEGETEAFERESREALRVQAAVYRRAGEALSGRGRPEEAAEWFSKAAELDRAGPGAHEE